MQNILSHIKTIFNRQFPKSFLIQKPVWGALTFFVILFLFVVVYQPLSVHGARSLSFSFTMLIYCFLVSAMVLVAALLIKKSNCFSKTDTWTVSKELLSITLILITIGLSVFFSGFILEDSGSRWNFSTFIDSFSRSVAVGIIPVFFPSLLNIRYAFTPEIFREYDTNKQSGIKDEYGQLIQIQSKAKKEELSFYPEEFIYAESEGNYVVFHLWKHEKAVEVIIRNSISEIEKQFQPYPFFLKIHRAFIVNLQKVSSKKGNSLGYQLQVAGSDKTLPVSRRNTKVFDEFSRKFLLSTQP